MIVLDIVAALVIAFGAFLGARTGFWRMATGAGAVALGGFAGWALSDLLADALGSVGVGYPGDVVLGFFLPFALVSIYARFLAGLWLSRLLADAPDRNRTLGAVAGAMWMVFAVGLGGRLLASTDGAANCDEIGDQLPPFVTWLTRYPGAVGAYAYLRPDAPDEPPDRAWSDALERALDSARAHNRSMTGDHEASQALHGAARSPDPSAGRVAEDARADPPSLSQH